MEEKTLNVGVEKFTPQEKVIYAKGCFVGLCFNCEKRKENDDYRKLPGTQPYCKGCRTKEQIDFLKELLGMKSEKAFYKYKEENMEEKEMELEIKGAEETPTETQNVYNVSFTVPACDIDGLHFNELKVENEVIQLLTTRQGKKIYCFENELFLSLIDLYYANGRPLGETSLGAYLENNFKPVLQEAIKHRVESVSLLSYDNVFNEYSEDYIPYLKNGAHRVKSHKDITHCYWLSTPCETNPANYCYVGLNGCGSNDNGSCRLGVAPAFCLM